METIETNIDADEATSTTTVPAARVVFTQGGKGGAGKTAFSSMLVEWYRARKLPHVVLDLDTGNKKEGSLKHFFPEYSTKVEIRTVKGFDKLVTPVFSGLANTVVADMGGGASDVAARWFHDMYESTLDAGILFTAVGIVTPDPSSVASILDWANVLRDRANYLTVRNHMHMDSVFTCWDSDAEAKRFRQQFDPAEITMENRHVEVETLARGRGLTMKGISELSSDKQASLGLDGADVARARTYTKRLFHELDRVRELLVP